MTNLRAAHAALDWSVKNLAAEGNPHYTTRQLYYEVCRTAKRPKGFDLPTTAAVLATGALPAIGLARRKTVLAGAFLAANAMVAGGLYWLRSTPHTLTPPVSLRDFENALENYLQKYQRPAGLLEFRSAPLGKQDLAAKAITLNQFADLPLYGLPRLLVCQSSEIAAMLKANQFHMEASCAVVHLQNGAPLDDIFREMLLRAENARVFFLHDASLEAYSLIPNLRERLDLPASVRMTILGLRPVHAGRLHLFAERISPIEQVKLETIRFLSDDEKRWLRDGWQAEVTAVHPARLLRVLRRLILGLPTPPGFWRFNAPPRDLGFMSENYG